MVTPACAACSATVRIVSTPHLNSSGVGPLPVNSPMAEWVGPTSIFTPAAWQQSSVFFMASTAAARTLDDGLIGLSPGPRTVTAVRSRPIASSFFDQPL